MPFKQFIAGAAFATIALILVWVGAKLNEEDKVEPTPPPVTITVPTLPALVGTLEFVTIKTSNWVDITVSTNLLDIVDWDFFKQDVKAVFSYDFTYSIGFDLGGHDWRPEPDNESMTLKLCAPALMVTNLNTRPEMIPVSIEGISSIAPQFAKQNPDVIEAARLARDTKISDYMKSLVLNDKLKTQGLKSLKAHIWEMLEMANKENQILNNIEFKEEALCNN